MDVFLRPDWNTVGESRHKHWASPFVACRDGGEVDADGRTENPNDIAARISNAMNEAAERANELNRNAQKSC